MASAQKRYINMPGRRGNLPFSDAVLAGDTLYISGRIGFRPGTTEVPRDPAEEARYLLDGIRTVVESAQMSMTDLVYVQIFCPDVSLFETFNAVYRGYFSGDMPARAFLGSGPLLFGARFEMMAIAQRA
jgi:2-iminobutanoate/2-iminopropanoate deaminase